VLSKLNQILASDVGFVEPVDDLGASESAGFIEKRKARNEADLLRALGAFDESSPRALRGDLSVMLRCTHLGASVSFTLTND
jgi:hypothetical protein